MSSLTFQKAPIFLEGLTRYGRLDLFNSDLNLAVTFTVQNPHPDLLQVSPSRGTVLTHQHEALHFYGIGKDFVHGEKLIITIVATFDNESNEKLNDFQLIPSWNRKRTELISCEVPIIATNSQLPIKSSIIEASFDQKPSRKEHTEISMIEKVSQVLGDSLMDLLYIPQLAKDKLKTRNFSKNTDQANHKLPIHEQKMPLIKAKRFSKEYSPSILNELSTSRNNPFSETQKGNDFDFPAIKLPISNFLSVETITPSAQQSRCLLLEDNNKNRNFQIIILAIIAALFFSIGANVGSLL